MHSLVDAELGQRITIRENGNSRRVTKKEALIKNLVNSAIKGQPAALKALVPLIVDTETANALADQRKTLSRDDAEILDAALARLGVQRKQNSDPEDEESKDG